MKRAKKWLSILLAVIFTASTPLSALASWEDGFVIPGQSSGSDGAYDDLFWDSSGDDQFILDDSSLDLDTGGTFEKDVSEKEDRKEDKKEESSNNGTMNIYKNDRLSAFSLDNSGSLMLADNYVELYGADSMPKLRSATGTDPYAYLQGNGGYVTITADRPLSNILHYDGKIVDNIHIAKWVADDPAALDYPAYCKNPGWKGTAQHSSGKYQVDPMTSIGAQEKKILGIARAGYPYKTPAELGCNSVDEAYYATHGAIHTAIVNGSLDKWSIRSGDTARNTRVLNALKKIYNEGIANPYTPPGYTVQLAPVSGSEEGTVDGDWIVNTYRMTSTIDRDTWKFRIMGDDLMGYVESGSIEVYADGRKLMPQTNISGAWDTSKGFVVPMNAELTLKVNKSLAEATGINYTLYGTTVGGDFSSAVSYLGDPVGLSGNWQGYIYNFRPQGTDMSMMTYNAAPTIPDEPDKDPDGGTTGSSDGSLLIEKLDYHTKKNAADAVFHIRGISAGCSYINIAVKASRGATAPILGKGANISISDGIIKLTGIPAGTYEVTEVSAPPHYSAAVGQNSQSVEVVDDAKVHPKVIFENKPYGSLTIRKIDADTQEKLPGFFFKVTNHTTGFEETVETGSNGEVTIEDLPEGTYVVEEISARFDYIHDPTPSVGEVDWGRKTTVVMENHKKPSIHIYKIDADTSEPISGVHFTITHKNTQQVYHGVTDSRGEIELLDVEEGWYNIEEVTPQNGYLPSDKVYEVYAASGRPGEVTIKNTLRSGIMIEKVDINGKGIEGVTFNIFRFGEDTPLPNSPVTTGKDGTVTIRNIDPGHYQIQEVQPKAGFLPNERVYDVTVEEGAQKLTKVQIVNHQAPDLTIIKRDSQTGETLKGAMFTVEKLEAPNKGFVTGSSFTTDMDGKILLKDLTPGAYKVCEVKAPNAYESGAEERIVNLVADQDFTAVFENTEKATLTVHKVDSVTKDPLQNARFEVFRSVNGSLAGEVVKVGEYTSDRNGQFVLDHVDTGWYRIVEKQAPSGYERKTESIDVFLKAGEDKEITLENSPMSAIIIKKVDADTGMALQGIKFEVRYLSGATGTEGNVIGTFTTSKNGTITVAGLKKGVYSIAEVSTDSDHILDETLKTVTLADDNAVVTVEFTNAPLGGLLIKKYDAVNKEPLSDVIFKVTHMNGSVVGESNGEYRTDESGMIYIPQLVGGFIVQEIKAKDGYMLDNTVKPIYIEKGRVYSLEFFNQPENTLVIHKMDGETKKPLADAVIKVTTVDDKFIREYRTPESGIITVDGLKPNMTVKVQEVKAPDGYVLDDTVHLVHLKNGEPQKFELYNYKRASLIIYKVDRRTQEPIEGVHFKVAKIDGTVIGEDYLTGADGRVIVPVEPGWYVATELAPAEGYNLDKTPSKNVQVKVNDPAIVKFENDKNATLRIEKTDKVTGKVMENVEFSIVRSDGKTYGKHYTDKRGEINLENALPAGTYLIRETNTIKGYALDTNVRKVTLDWDDDKLIQWENYPLASIHMDDTKWNA